MGGDRALTDDANKTGIQAAAFWTAFLAQILVFLTFRGRPIKGLILILARSWRWLSCSLMRACQFCGNGINKKQFCALLRFFTLRRNKAFWGVFGRFGMKFYVKMEKTAERGWKWAFWWCFAPMAACCRCFSVVRVIQVNGGLAPLMQSEIFALLFLWSTEKVLWDLRIFMQVSLCFQIRKLWAL